MYGYIRVREGPRLWVDISGMYRTREAAVSRWVYYMMIAEHVVPSCRLVEREYSVEFRPWKAHDPGLPKTREKVIYRAPACTYKVET